MAESYTQWVARLQTRVIQLYNDSPRMSVEELAKEKSTCESFLQNLYDHAEKNDINIMPYYQQLADIQFNLTRIEARIQEKKQLPPPIRNLQRSAEDMAWNMAQKGCLTMILGGNLWGRQKKEDSGSSLSKSRRPRDE